MICIKRLVLHGLPSSSSLLYCAQRSLVSTSIYDSVKQTWNKCSSKKLLNASPKKLQPYLRLMRFDKPIGSLLLYWPCTWSIALATPPGCFPSLYMLGLFGAGAFCMRSAGCVINDLWDKDFDRRVERTKLRPVASGEVSEKQAIALLAGLLSLSLSILLHLNWLSVCVGASSMALVVSYPLAKRYTYWPQLILGCTFNWGVLLGYTAISNHFSPSICVPLYLSGICWTVIYDTIYAHQDKFDDQLIGVKSTALWFSKDTKLWLSGFSIAMASNLAAVGWISEQIWPFYFALAGTAVHLTWQLSSVRLDNKDDCWKKFRANQWIGPFIFLGVVISGLLKTQKTVNGEEGSLKNKLIN